MQTIRMGPARMGARKKRVVLPAFFFKCLFVRYFLKTTQFCWGPILWGFACAFLGKNLALI